MTTASRIERAYGHLWAADSADRRVHEARRLLLSVIADGRGLAGAQVGINAAIADGRGLAGAQVGINAADNVAAGAAGLEASRAAIAYDEAIRSCANDPDRMASFCTAQGDDLDALYARWIRLSRIAVALGPGGAT